MKKTSPVYLFLGPEEQIALDFKEKLLKQIPEPLLALNYKEFSLKEESISDLIDALNTIPVASPIRVIYLKEALNEINKEESERLNAYFKNPNPSSILVIYNETIDKRKALYKGIKKVGEITDVSKLSYGQLAKYVNDYLKEAGKSINSTNLKELIRRLNYNNESLSLIFINQLLEQLISLTEDEEIKKEDILEIVYPSVEESVFKLLEDVLNKNTKNLKERLDELLSRGENPIGLMALFVYQIRNLLKVKTISNKKPQQIAKELGLNLFVVKKYLPLSKKFSQKKLIDLFNKAAEYDLAVKTGRMDQNFALEYLLLQN